MSGVDRLIFPVVEVEDIMDSRGKRYKEGVDFCVKNGQIVWHQNAGPGVDPKTGKGLVCGVRFSYHPFWLVKNLVHEVRLVQAEDEFGERVVQRMPQMAVLQREYQYFKEANDPQAKDPEKRQSPGPDSGQFGPR